MSRLAEVETAFADLLHEVDVLLPPPDGGPARPHPDAVADLLAFLAERQSLLQERRHAEKRDLLAWLEGEIGCSVEDLAGKTRVKAYELHTDAAVLAVLSQNHPARVAVDVSAPADYGETNPVRDRIVRGLERSRSRLAPMLRELELAEKLTDRIVYRLYGLTPEQVATVETTFD